MTKSILLSRAAAQAAAVLGACLLAFAGPASAFTPSPSPSKTGGESTPLNLTTSSSTAPHASSGGASIVRTIVGLAIVIAVIWGLSWILRQVKAGRDPQAPSGGLASVATLPLGSGRSVHLVRAGSEYVLLGSAEHGLMPIHRYTEEQAREAGLLPAQEPGQRSRRASLVSQITAGRDRVTSTAARDPMGAELARDPIASMAGREAVRADPMRMPAPGSGLLERVREWTVRG